MFKRLNSFEFFSGTQHGNTALDARWRTKLFRRLDLLSIASRRGARGSIFSDNGVRIGDVFFSRTRFLELFSLRRSDHKRLIRWTNPSVLSCAVWDGRGLKGNEKIEKTNNDTKERTINVAEQKRGSSWMRSELLELNSTKIPRTLSSGLFY